MPAGPQEVNPGSWHHSPSQSLSSQEELTVIKPRDLAPGFHAEQQAVGLPLNLLALAPRCQHLS